MSTLNRELPLGRRRSPRTFRNQLRNWWRPQSAAAIRPMPVPVVVALSAAITLSVLAAWLLVFAFGLSGVQQSRTNSVLYSKFRETLSAATVPIGGIIEPGTPIALLHAPGTGMPDEVVVEGTAPTDLTAGPGHLRTTPLPGQAGVSTIFGRSTTFGAPFANIAKFRVGQRLTVTTGQATLTFLVTDVRHRGDPQPQPVASDGSRLTLVTAGGGLFSASRTVYVDAALQGAVEPTLPGRINAVPRSESAMQGDTSVLLPLVLWLQLLLLVVLAAVWAKARWGFWQAWVIGVPAVIAVLWATSDRVLMLLPNLI